MSTYKSKQGIYILFIISILIFVVSCSKKHEEPLQSEPTLEQIIAEIKFPAPDTIIGRVGDYTIDFKTIEEKMMPTIQKSEKLFSPEQMKIFRKQIIGEYLKIWAELRLFSSAADKENITIDENDLDNIMTYFKIQTPPTLTTEEYLKMLSFEKDDLNRIIKAQKYVIASATSKHRTSTFDQSKSKIPVTC